MTRPLSTSPSQKEKQIWRQIKKNFNWSCLNSVEFSHYILRAQWTICRCMPVCEKKIFCWILAKTLMLLSCFRDVHVFATLGSIHFKKFGSICSSFNLKVIKFYQKFSLKCSFHFFCDGTLRIIPTRYFGPRRRPAFLPFDISLSNNSTSLELTIPQNQTSTWSLQPLPLWTVLLLHNRIFNCRTFKIL